MTEPLYSAEQIKIPSDLPEILKNYAKFIIKSQPADILASSSEYFARLAKQRTQANAGKRLSDMQLDAFYTKFSSSEERSSVSRKDIEEAASLANIPSAQVQDIFLLGGWTSDKIPWVKFWAFLCASAAGTLEATAELVCNLVGDNGKVPVALIQEVVVFLVEQDRAIDPAIGRNIVQAFEGISQREYPTKSVLEIVLKELQGNSLLNADAPVNPESDTHVHMDESHPPVDNMQQDEAANIDSFENKDEDMNTTGQEPANENAE
ncbi:hypothetical protein BATDEDRAFT_34112 [Batrachochytrium dendrobatidis JAM81]|uniref:RIIa domain-containing protein n=2 Tax=Batrachochytrium dendrobatidis TaxID=109871 RepID=F4NVP9_BATDJ|nr:uncharacterized protein BATDEDRAFT_34112 [Batrachochytrium dendrobatidis JAM81]EGF84122.1 hypothetical protein BATDEDRAFT_34112 [Batrachochytrium dendrobatidis JAM81]KAJ8329478.1 hypothetical protein O5D80_002309 [Batrachochytrium dendrobatidis]KAK5668567.1 hypothetical protein QVD99_005576 [Batrachochytrium dendrobatidis]OAJ36677.1 hypothetical protein BDEG_20827 [Batrachochytrium dendrobatidis JEL423]|eukprot:XP_006675754.1 hypothetical protein BATDEDRAFT_34112 [Batrachochytrium dendrobatidis JAM81]